MFIGDSSKPIDNESIHVLTSYHHVVQTKLAWAWTIAQKIPEDRVMLYEF